jgi:hypothetical protein
MLEYIGIPAFFMRFENIFAGKVLKIESIFIFATPLTMVL